ncbi:restless-like transposase [Purpureocillium lavendulum]|uniref:Restless-like transposase n=1 Tax=Purpureocillium lavendulum TaxID=1247861 RepID=A0AB34FBB4_9HYPO|nr:ricin-type beta-trefoil lectin domain protein [Purpureocillium lavendulum]KAJ6436836.1 restless-like transposase [Purpureocillium lavendulum]
MVTLLVVGAYPTFDFLVGRASLSALLFPIQYHIRITVGDALFTLSQVYSAYYLFELCFRTRFASGISIAHHIGLLVIIQTALALFANFQEHPEATMEFYMCLVWGISTNSAYSATRG